MTATTAGVVSAFAPKRLLRGRVEDPPWARSAALALLVATGVLYVVGLGASGWANDFYAAAAQAGGASWKAWFFGSLDSANFITVDKPPASLWVMGLSVRAFGLSSWSVLVPQALEGVAAVGVLYTTVRRWFGPAAGLLAGAVLATTPVATLMFRFDNPDALLVLLLVAAVYATTRAVESGRTGWLLLAGTFVGFGFLTKMLQALLVVPALGLAYLIAGPPRLGRRIPQLLAALAAMIVSAGWYVALVELVPASSRPYIGGSQTNSILELTLGYNGFGRITGNQTGAVVPGGNPRPGAWGQTGITRLFGSEMGTQASWLLPAALVAMVALLVLAGRSVRTDRMRALAVVWGGWLLVTGAVFSFAAGIIHPYYTVALAPAIGALVGVGAVAAWRRRHGWTGAAVLVVMVLVTCAWSWVLLARTPDWLPWLRYVVAGLGLVAVLGVLGTRLFGAVDGRSLLVRLGVATAGVGLVAMLAAPFAYSLQTASTANGGAIPSAGPARSFGAAMRGGGGLGPDGGGHGARPVDGRLGRHVGGPPPGMVRQPERAGGGMPGGGVRSGGMLGGSQVSGTLTALLSAGATGYTWVAATTGANSSASLQLATEKPVMALGGFNGTDPAPSLARFQQLVEDGKVHYFVDDGRQGGPGGDRKSSIADWVARNFTKQTVGGMSVYDLSSPKNVD